MEISVKKILQLLISNIWILVICALVSGAVGYTYSRYRIPPTYSASMKLMVVSENQTSSPSEVAIMRRMVNTYVELLDSRDFNEKIAEASGLSYSPGALKGMITYSIKEDSEAFSVTVVAGDPDHCTKILNCLETQAQEYVRSKYSHSTITAVESPSTPWASSQTNRNTLIALFAGLVLPALIIIIWSEFDIRVKSEEELTARYDIPVLGSVPTFDLKKKRKASKDDDRTHRQGTIAEQEVTFNE